MAIIGIIGSRKRLHECDYNKVLEQFLKIYQEGDWICSGGCPIGGDFFAYRLHKYMYVPYLEFPANWEKHGKAAGFIRNTDIAKHSTVLIACVSEDRTGGTEDTIKKFKQLHPEGIVYLI
jgi:hypothetical protein